MTIGFDASRAFISQRTGTEQYSYALLKHLLQIDQKNHYRIYLRNSLGKNDPLLAADNVEVVAIRQPKLWTQVGLAREVFFRTPDVLFIPAHTLPVVHKPGLRSVVTIHDLGAEYLPQYHQFPQKYYLNTATEYAVNHATKLIAVSEATRQDLITKLKANPAKISVVYEGFDQTRFQPKSTQEINQMRGKCGIKEPYVLFVGTIQPRKNLERLIQAWAQIVHGSWFMVHDQTNNQEPTTKNQPPVLILAGRKGWMSEQIYNAPEKYDIAGNVRFLDYVAEEELPTLMSGAEAFVFPSLFEGFGIPVLEAMACGTPVVTSNISSLPEVGGEAALYVDPYSVEDMAAKITSVLSDSQLRQVLIQKGFEQVKKFSWQKAAAETLKVLEETRRNTLVHSS